MIKARKSTDEGLDHEYNSIDAQRDAGHAYIASQRAEGWIPVPTMTMIWPSRAATWNARRSST